MNLLIDLYYSKRYLYLLVKLLVAERVDPQFAYQVDVLLQNAVLTQQVGKWESDLVGQVSK